MKNLLISFILFPCLIFGLSLQEVGDQLPGTTTAIFPISGGATNQNYVIQKENNSYFVRVGQATDTDLEAYAAQIASDLRIGPAVVLYLLDEKILVSEFLPNSGLDWSKENYLDFVSKAKTLHSIKEFPRFFNLDETLESYSEFASLKSQIIGGRESVLCHLDLHKGNLIYSHDKIWIIDWEYAALADPLHDLASFASVEKMNDEEMEELLILYLGKWDESAWNDLYIYRIWHDVRWADWCSAREFTSEIDYPYAEAKEDFLKEAKERFSHLLFF